MTYNVLEEPWIPVVSLDGQKKKMGILETLRNAHELKEISDSNIAFEYGMYRLLCIFLMDAFRFKYSYEIIDLYEQQIIPMHEIEAYVDTCKNEGVSFDLFDKDRPFLQSKYDEKYDKNETTIAKLDFQLPTGRNHIHFDHRRESEQEMNLDDVVKGLCTINLFCTAGAQGYPSTVNGTPPLYFMVNGKNLFETLILSLVSEEEMEEGLFQSQSNIPIWRSNRAVIPKEKTQEIGLLSGMIFPCRRVCLIPTDSKKVKSLYFCQGIDFNGYEVWRDPHVSYVYSDNGRVSLKPDMEKEPWRNITSIMASRGWTKNATAPSFVQKILDECLLPVLSLKAYAVTTDQANYLDVNKSVLTMPTLIASDPMRVNVVYQIIQKMEKNLYAIGKVLANNDMKSIKNTKKDYAAEIKKNYLQKCKELLFDKIILDLVEDDLLYESFLENEMESINILCCQEFEMVMSRYLHEVDQMIDLVHMKKLLYWMIRERKEDKK